MSTSIDPTDYIEVEHGSLRFSDEKQQGKFELGVCMAVYKWEELATAVENSWGGPKSNEKRDWISGIVIELFDEKAVDIQLIEETLLYAMVDEFDTEVDNDSALEIAALIMKFYKDVTVHNYTDIDQLYNRWQEKQNSGQHQSHKVTVESDPNNPDVSDSEEEEDEEEHHEGCNHDHEHDHMEIDEPAGPVVDEDGFELVQSKGRRRR
ncbi:uncharacterized protein SPAPADRAFT_53174 [Spathaspora passalidarum NRRL Y-27907]|uniref:Pre-rRNA-processing protein TSR2 n=1 Tax=Spathaspora passalidarum (strain NRRL Y-27907 / 11-Y1) TaxID=619300 RepID=G3AEJ6_SPAPN|nr:uncharacterized protein SPAPADRAFT_53174 [Spathaspora passalidarum NRRL Y-27907]EGW34759.1 hypothetical protein SPAPADRAFT_53174 [Spathaspora passalidarum NRRL Y-27907]